MIGSLSQHLGDDEPDPIGRAGPWAELCYDSDTPADTQHPAHLGAHTSEAGATGHNPSQDIAPPKRRSTSPIMRLSQSDAAPTPEQNRRANTRSPTTDSRYAPKRPASPTVAAVAADWSPSPELSDDYAKPSPKGDTPLLRATQKSKSQM